MHQPCENRNGFKLPPAGWQQTSPPAPLYYGGHPCDQQQQQQQQSSKPMLTGAGNNTAEEDCSMLTSDCGMAQGAGVVPCMPLSDSASPTCVPLLLEGESLVEAAAHASAAAQLEAQQCAAFK